jgi:hypothetical protein
MLNKTACVPLIQVYGKLYHNLRGNKINDYDLKSSVFIEVDVLWTSGRHKYLQSSGKAIFKNETFLPEPDNMP